MTIEILSSFVKCSSDGCCWPQWSHDCLCVQLVLAEADGPPLVVALSLRRNIPRGCDATACGLRPQVSGKPRDLVTHLNRPCDVSSSDAEAVAAWHGNSC